MRKFDPLIEEVIDNANISEKTKRVYRHNTSAAIESLLAEINNVQKILDMMARQGFQTDKNAKSYSHVVKLLTEKAVERRALRNGK